ncbi:MAG: DNA recombination protein RmuC [Dehalococcoidia bacterium]|nr:DNA recombination protein RmuC [Dehalococcoidia bacterium]
MATGLRQSADAIRTELTKAQEGIARLQEAGQARQQLEAATAESVRRLETVLAGTQSKGAAGENIVDLVFSRLPAEWQERDFRVNGKQVEFALRLPNRRVLPIDSKWPATGLIEELAQAETPEAAAKARNEVQRAVRDKMAEVQKYLDPELTHGFAIAVVPDAVFEVCGEAQADAFRKKVVLVSYSMFVPYLLVVFQAVLASDHDIDLERLQRTLEEAETQLKDMSEEIEGRLSRALTMLGNSRDDLRSQVARTRSGLASVQVREGEGSSALPAIEGSADPES